MLHVFDFVRELNFLSVLIRLVLAVLCGGIIGIEREFKRRPAGFRTHILICLGAALTTLTSQYLFLELRLYTDVARLGAQVIAGIGFIGAGSIIVTKRQRVKGLTTAAGLWTAAIIGLVCGAGYIELAIFSTLSILVVETLLIKVEKRYARLISTRNIYVEYEDSSTIEMLIHIVKEHHVNIDDMEITRVGEGEKHHFAAVLALEVSEKELETDIMKHFSSTKGVLSIEEL